MDNLEKLATQATQDKQKQNKNTTQYVLDTITRKQTQVNKTWALLQTTGGKNEPNWLVFMRKWQGDHNTELTM